MEYMYDNDECLSRNFGGSQQFTNWISDSKAMCHIMPQVQDFITVFLDDTDKHIEVADGHHVKAGEMASTNKNVQQ